MLTHSSFCGHFIMTLNSIYDMIMFIVAIMGTHCIKRANVHIAVNAFTEAR